MKYISETPIGNLSPASFRPTEAEKLVLLNIADMNDEGRHVTQQDAINVPEEKLQAEELNKDQLESAYKQLINIRLVQVEPDQSVTISPEGLPVVEELKKAEQQKAEQEPPMPDQAAMSGPDVGLPGAASNAGPSAGMPLEGIELIRYLNDMSKLL